RLRRRLLDGLQRSRHLRGKRGELSRVVLWLHAGTETALALGTIGGADQVRERVVDVVAADGDRHELRVGRDRVDLRWVRTLRRRDDVGRGRGPARYVGARGLQLG